MSITEFDAAQTDADAVPAQAINENPAGCCGPCDPCEAHTFKQNCSTRRLNASSVRAPIRQAWRRYQDYKCGPQEYNIYGSWLAASALRNFGRTAALADGLAPEPPRGAKPSARFGCCLLEAKWSTPNSSQALYVGQSTFVRTARQKTWLTARYSRFRLNLLNRLGRRITLRNFATMVWTEAWTNALSQAAIYQGFVESGSTPYTDFLYICGEMRFVRDYHSRLIRGMMKSRVTHSPFRDGYDWKTSGRPQGC